MMNNPLAKIFLGWGLFFALAWMTGCAATNQTSLTPIVNPTVAVTVTALPSPTANIATSTPEVTPTFTIPSTAGGGTSVTINGVTVTLTGFSSDSSSTTVDFCIMTIPNLPSPDDIRDYGPVPGPSLLIDQMPAPFLGGGAHFSSGLGCEEMKYQVGTAQIEQAHHVALSIDDIRMMGGPIGDPNVACEAARTKLRQQYPGLDFQCHFSMAGYYTNLQLPTGMTETQAQKIIFDTIEGAIYGPWVLNIKG